MQIADYGRPYEAERPYYANGYKAIGPPKEHFCKQCKSYYKNIHQKGITDKDFYPTCYGDISQQAIEADVAMLDTNELELATIYADPVSFAAAEFKWKPRWYQLEMLRCTSLKKIIRAGRRLGKTECAAVMILWLLYTNAHYTVLVICPFQSQVKRIFDMIRKFIGDSLTYSQSVARDVSSPFNSIHMANGSSVMGFSSGSNSGGKSSQVRGQDANCLVLDEADFLGDEDLESILAILASHPDCLLWASSTPTGARRFFFNWAINKTSGFKEFHYISAESPVWSDTTNEFLKGNYSEGGFSREFLSEFGDETAGVFKGADINKSLYDYNLAHCRYDQGCAYVIGVDWNGDTIGTHIVVVESRLDAISGVKYKLVEKIIIDKSEFTQLKAVEEIIRLDQKWSSSYIYVDYGYGATQVEMLKRYGKEHPNSRLDRKVVGIHMGGNVEIKDPVTREDVKKPAKPFMVGVAARQMESERCIFPASEDTDVLVADEDGETAQMGIVQQMRQLRVLKIAKNGSPTYSGENEHTLTAWMLAILGFFMEMSDINKIMSSATVRFSGHIGSKGKEGSPEEIARLDTENRKRLVPKGRTLPAKPIVMQSNAHSVMRRDKLLKGFKKDTTDPFRGLGGPGRRTTF